jgi:hypothetical protein
MLPGKVQSLRNWRVRAVLRAANRFNLLFTCAIHFAQSSKLRESHHNVGSINSEDADYIGQNER